MPALEIELVLDAKADLGEGPVWDAARARLLFVDITRGLVHAFDPETARALLRRLEFHYTPKHGSWLNVAENELSSMTRQCLQHRRFGTLDELRKETAAWHNAVNDRQRGVDWQLRIDDARVKLRSVYPKIIE